MDEMDKQKKEGRTVIHGEATEEGKDILDGLLGGDILEVGGKSVCDEDAVESGLATGVEIYLLEGAEAVVVDGEVDGNVGWRGEAIVGEVVVGSGKVHRSDQVRQMISFSKQHNNT
jgi:hypothetical protein